MKQRRTWIVDRKLQHRLIKMIVALGVFISLISLGGLQFLSVRIFEMMKAEELSTRAHLLLMQELNNLTLVIVILSAICLILSWLAGLIFSNQIAGPVFNMTKTLDLYLEGDQDFQLEITEEDTYSRNKIYDRIPSQLLRVCGAS